MSGKELDNLFRNKLEELEQTPSPKAWDKLEAGLADQQKKTRFPYWRVAAAILLLVSFACVFVWTGMDMSDRKVSVRASDDVIEGRASESVRVESGNSANVSVSEEGQANVSNELLTDGHEELMDKEKQEDTTPDVDLVDDNGVKNQVAMAISKGNEENVMKQIGDDIEKSKGIGDDQVAFEAPTGQSSNEVLKEITNSEVLSQETGVIVETLTENIQVEATSPSDVASTTQAAEEKQSTVMVFNIEEFDKKTAVASLGEEAQGEVKQSKFKKILNFVKNVKEGNRGMANIREAKDDLFTFDSRKEENDSE
ncbi:MAG: hypothetical protein AAFN93_04715 [Bacteroidota bacterium]